jgi:hypothetical protein
MDDDNKITEDELAAQEPELLPDREAMTVLQPLPPVPGEAEGDILFPKDPVPPVHSGGAT